MGLFEKIPSNLIVPFVLWFLNSFPKLAQINPLILILMSSLSEINDDNFIRPKEDSNLMITDHNEVIDVLKLMWSKSSSLFVDVADSIRLHLTVGSENHESTVKRLLKLKNDSWLRVFVYSEAGFFQHLRECLRWFFNNERI